MILLGVEIQQQPYLLYSYSNDEDNNLIGLSHVEKLFVSSVYSYVRHGDGLWLINSLHGCYQNRLIFKQVHGQTIIPSIILICQV